MPQVVSELSLICSKISKNILSDIYMYVFAHICTYIIIYTHIYIDMIHTYTHVFAHIHNHTYRHIHRYDTYIHTYAGLCRLALTSQCWDNRQGSLAYVWQWIESRALYTLDKHFCQLSYIPGQENYVCYLKTQLPYLLPSSAPGTVHCFLCR
jgi:hypothetical protein